MERFQGFIFKLAETHRNAPLDIEAKTQLQNRFSQFLSQYKTPDHPPYSAMIERALHELNEKGGSSEESISLFLTKEYSDLPWAHLTLLKHHLGKLCESGDIVVTLGKRYMLAGDFPCQDSSSKSKMKRSRKRKGKWKRDRETKRDEQRGDQVEVAEIYRGTDVQEQQLAENGVNVEDNQVREDQIKVLLSADDGGYGVFGNPRSFPNELRQEDEQAGVKLPELATPERPPGFESVIVENLSQFGVDGRNDCHIQEQGTITSTELGTLSKLKDHHSPRLELPNAVRPQREQNTLELTPLIEQQQQQDEKQSELLKEDVVSETKDQGIKTYCRRGKAKSQAPQDVDMKLEQVAGRPSVNLLEPNTTVDTSDLSLASKFEVAKDEKSTDSLRPQRQHTVYRLRSRASSKLKPEAKVSTKADVMEESPCDLEVPQPPKCKRRGRPPKPELGATVQENFTFAYHQNRQDLERAGKRTCSGKVEAVKIEEVLLSNDFIPVCEAKPLEEQQKSTRRGRPPRRQRRSAIK